ncbi:MAG: SAM-dependent methyltransferase [Bdellovibrionales bacterium]|jgi:NADH dehydrogenase [ubiquinone] 1 alpha subcomplex assembly factor 7
MTALENILRDVIKAEGPVTVARFMQLALSHPQHGYYIKGDPLGVAADFTTAPEISQMFGEMIGLWMVEQWQAQGSPAPFTLLELGAGRGTLLADALRATAKVPNFHTAMRLRIIESNETLKAMQRDKLAAYHPTYGADLSDLPEHPVFMIANEFFDVMPIHQYERHAEGWRERLVGLDETGSLIFVAGTQTIPLPLPEGVSFYELSPAAIGLAQAMGSHIAAQGGAALIIDYGYAENSGSDTLQAVSGHASVDPLARAGAVDLTAHVDFAALRLVALKEAVFVPPIIGQGAFLKALGIDLRARQLKMQGTLEQADAIDEALHRLTSAEEMGVLFKVMAISPKAFQDLAGFP